MIAELPVLASALATAGFWESVFGTGVRVALPLGLAAMGELIGERAGVLNLCVEGTMAVGALAGVAAAAAGGPTLGIGAGLLAGAVAGLVFALLVVHWRINEIVVGFAYALGGLALATFLYRGIYDARPAITPFRAVEIPGLSSIPIIGPALFDQPLIVWLLPIVTAVVAWVLTRTRIGLAVRAVGDGPHEARARGIDVEGTRIAALCVAGSMAGAGGAILAAGLVGEFSDQIVGGRGFLALALVIASGWRPWVLFAAVLSIGALQGLQLRAQTLDLEVPVEFFQALPFVVTLAVLAFGLGAARSPRSLGRVAEGM
jgi:general nucleoside transport system permease protein